MLRACRATCCPKQGMRQLLTVCIDKRLFKDYMEFSNPENDNPEKDSRVTVDMYLDSSPQCSGVGVKMTTAARPTFEPARGGRGKGEGDLSQLSKQYSSRDLPSHTKIKYRQTTQDAPEEVRNRDFRRELEERERVAAREKNRDRPTREHTTSSSVSKKPRLDQIPAANLDADDPLTDEDDEDEDLEDSDDDDTAALLAELEKIKKERAEEQARKEQEQKAEEERIRMENILSGNPLLNLTGPAQPQANFKVKRRWDDDVVFKNCAKGIDETKKDKRFVNDTLRSEFHKKFMEKYIK
ncbi:hypothetical protein HGM15179_008354 [Zosterops borbonicus]|nr:hypothetical protein HGM15179_008354 [Zosterops borbonicus]